MSVSRGIEQGSVARAQMDRLRLELDWRRNAAAIASTAARSSADAALMSNSSNHAITAAASTAAIEKIREEERQRSFTTEYSLKLRNADLESKVASLRESLDSSQAAVDELHQHSARLEADNQELRSFVEDGRLARLRAEELSVRCDELFAARTHLEKELHAALNEDTCRVLQGKVEALTNLLEAREKKEDELTLRISQLLEDGRVKDRMVEQVKGELHKTERVAGEWEALSGDLRNKLKAETATQERQRARWETETAERERQLKSREDEIDQLSTVLNELQTEMRMQRRAMNAMEVEAEERRSEMTLLRRELDSTRDELTRLQKADAATTEKWRGVIMAKDSNEAEYAKERVIAQAQVSELKQLRAANSALEGIVEGLRVDLRTVQRMLDDERSASAKDNERMRVLIVQTHAQQQAAAAADRRGPASILSPSRPLAM
jgi:chromosome segregation ATPase